MKTAKADALLRYGKEYEMKQKVWACILLAALLALSACEKLPEPTRTPGPTPKPEATASAEQGAKPVPTPGGYIKPEDRVYVPDPDMETEAEAMQERMNEAMLFETYLSDEEKLEYFHRLTYYSFEVKDSLTLDGKDYSVIWLYAEGFNGEWADVVFTRDAELAALLGGHREMFWELRRDRLERKREGIQINTMETLDLSDEKLSHTVTKDAGEYWIFFEGDGLAFFDCGFTDGDAQIEEFSNLLGHFARHYSRDVIEGVNRFSTKAPQ